MNKNKFCQFKKMLSLYQFLKIKSKVSPTITLKKDKDGINPILTKPSNFFCRRKKDLEGFLFWWGSYLFYTLAELVSVSTKSNSIISCGQSKFSLCGNSQREMLIKSYYFRLFTRAQLTGKLDLLMQ